MVAVIDLIDWMINWLASCRVDTSLYGRGSGMVVSLFDIEYMIAFTNSRIACEQHQIGKIVGFRRIRAIIQRLVVEI